MTLYTLCQLSPFCREPHDERAAICFADFARDQPARCQSIENAGQGRSLVREASVEIGHVGRAGMSKQRQNVRFPLRQAALPQVVKIKADPVRGAVDWMNKSQWHRLKAASDPAPPMKFALDH
jgi:hypothetical protein